MTLRVNNKSYLITTMIVMRKDDIPETRCNVFNEDYKFITSVSYKNEEDLINHITNCL